MENVILTIICVGIGSILCAIVGTKIGRGLLERHIQKEIKKFEEE